MFTGIQLGGVNFVIEEVKLVYNVGKQVLKYQGYRIPTKADLLEAKEFILKMEKSASVSNMVQAAKNIPKNSWKRGALISAELAGLFVIGEQLGRGNLIGYKD
ncbi:hypothetical protein AX774_g6059 [Zancudomyces culisetae]|uniref:ATP synthase subunit g, mitochondrial n=1 Tax=Zancudomyces culisetae TaxID=1213189 RepID=A0A1R1PHX7_ZANCU|nr:hypothetical protein AX774_g7644 [Zancudomyces culisetae]OMH80513.1 hypothetical protein AX774_g6059 [Zancudomyces culisetae]|eukprot:OMH78961.1 hypothetical protein AX774_g7644 [Zancudomyces culisetae]